MEWLLLLILFAVCGIGSQLEQIASTKNDEKLSSWAGWEKKETKKIEKKTPTIIAYTQKEIDSGFKKYQKVRYERN